MRINKMDACRRPEIGRVCPNCHQGVLNYNDLLNLVCTHCSREWIGSIT